MESARACRIVGRAMLPQPCGTRRGLTATCALRTVHALSAPECQLTFSHTATRKDIGWLLTQYVLVDIHPLAAWQVSSLAECTHARGYRAASAQARPCMQKEAVAQRQPRRVHWWNRKPSRNQEEQKRPLVQPGGARGDSAHTHTNQVCAFAQQSACCQPVRSAHARQVACYCQASATAQLSL